MNFMLVLLPIAMLAAFACANLHNEHGVTLRRFLKETFTPTSWREFLLPPCVLCWGVRVAAVGLAIAVMV
jgi:hypothetical protein